MFIKGKGNLLKFKYRERGISNEIGNKNELGEICFYSGKSFLFFGTIGEFIRI